MSERAERCETCRFWDTENSDEGWGDCRRYPPTKMLFEIEAMGHDKTSQDIHNSLGDSSSVWVWPYTESDDWCGEWQEH